MSLLMDALRRAEEAKRLTSPPGAPPAAAPAELSLTPLEAPPSPRDNALPPLSRHFDSVDADLASAAAGPPPRRRAPMAEMKPADTSTDDAAERLAARNVFAAKQVPRSRMPLWLFLGLGGVATLAIGGYFWWQLQSIPGGSLSRPTEINPPAARPALAPTRPASSSGPALATEAPPAAPPLAATLAERPWSRPASEVSAPAARPALRREAAASQPGEVSSVFRAGSSRTRQDQTINLAYEAWQADRLDDARRGYEQVLRSDPRNADALLGMAAIDARQGRIDRAQELYQRVLDSDPTDATAQAALINLRGQSDAGQSESRLKTLLAGQPESSALHFALGNLYARQGRWGEAQQAYFQSYALDPDNPDYLFNVAVSLDHLRQSKLAAQYYRMALNAADTRRSSFDRSVAGKRSLELQP